jgi:hypothetical protein
MNNLMSGVSKSLQWSVSLAGKFFRVVPVCTIVAVVATVFSQFFLLVGFLLPLKVVLLLGSEQVPHYFPVFLKDIGRDWLIIVLSFASVVFYSLHLFAASVVEQFSVFGAKRLLEKSKKMTIFEGQEEIAFKGFQRYSQSLASLFFLVICLVVMLFFYPRVAFVILFYFVAAALVLSVISSFSTRFRARYSDSLGVMPKVLGSVGFLCSFAFIVLDHLSGSAPSLLIAVVSLLLVRQLFSRASTLIKDQYDLYRQKTQLSILFFYGGFFHGDAKSKHQEIWSLVNPEVRDRWLADVVAEIPGFSKCEFSVSWLQMGVPNIFCYLLAHKDGGGRQLLVKIFNANLSSLAKHEATLLVRQHELPTLPFLNATTVEGLSCHVFDASDYRCCTPQETNKAQMAFRAILSACKPSDALSAIYVRSRPRFWQHLDSDLLDRLEYVLADDSNPIVFDRFRVKLQEVRRFLECLPHCLLVQDVRPGMLWADLSDNLVLANWTRWELEPVGVRWSFDAQTGQFVERLNSARHFQNKAVDVPQLRLSSLSYDFISFINRARYLEAYALIDKILDAYDEI